MAAREIKTSLAIDGEQQFKRAMDEAYRGLKVLGSEMKLNTSIFGDNAQSMEGLTKKGEILSKQIAQQKEIVAALAKAVEESAAAYGETDKRTDDYRTKLNNATAALNNMERELSSNESAINDFGKEVKSADDKSNKWRETLSKVGETLGKSLVTAAKTAAVAIGTVTVAAGAAAVKLGKEVVKSFGELEQNLGGSEAVFGQYADAIQKSGEEAYKNLGTSQSQYLATANKMGALFQGSGIEQQRSLELTTQAMQRAADMASVMGIDTQVAMDSVAGAAKGNFTMMDNLGVAMNATTIEAYALAKGLDFTWNSASNAQKAEVAMQMFFENTQQYAGNFARESTQTISGSLGMLQAATSSFIAGLGNANADMTALTGNMVAAFQAVVTNITPVMQNIVSALPAVVDVLVTGIGSMLPQLITTATDMFSQVLTMLVALLPQLTPVAIDAILTITQALVSNIPMIITAAGQLIMGLINGIQTALPQLMPAAVSGITTFIQGIISGLPQILKAGIDILIQLVKGLTQAIPQLVPAAVEGLMTVVETIIDNLPEIIRAGVELVVALIKGIIDSLPKIIQAMPKIIKSYVAGLIDNIETVITTGVDLLMALVDGIIKSIPELVKAAPQIIGAIVSALVAGIPKLLNVGVQMVQGIWNGIKSMATWFWEQLSTWFKDALGWIGKLLGIKSPSRVMAEMIGKPMAEGVAMGIAKNADSVNEAMRSLVPDTTMVVDVARRFNNIDGPGRMIADNRLAVTLDDAALDRLAGKIAAIVDPSGLMIVMNDREFGRMVRRAVPA